MMMKFFLVSNRLNWYIIYLNPRFYKNAMNYNDQVKRICKLNKNLKINKTIIKNKSNKIKFILNNNLISKTI